MHRRYYMGVISFRKRAVLWTVIAGSLLALASPKPCSAVNLLRNPSFETLLGATQVPNNGTGTVVGWNYEVHTGPISTYLVSESKGASPKYFHTGDAMRIGPRSSPVGTHTTVKLYQDRPVAANTDYAASVYVRTDSRFGLNPSVPDFAGLWIQELRADGTVAVDHAPVGVTASTAAYVKQELSFHASANTAKVRFILYTHTQHTYVDGDGCIKFDEAVLSGPLVGAETIYVANPGEDQDIKPALEAAILSASPGDTVILPKGNFQFVGRILTPAKPIRICGQGKNKTRLYRTVDSNLAMIQFVGSGDQSEMEIEMSGIWFQGMPNSTSYGDGLSQTSDMGVTFQYCNPCVHHCRFQYFGSVALSVRHRDAAGAGLVYENEFLDNYKLIDPNVNTNGYGVCTGGEELQWIDDPHLGGSGFLFVENNYFSKHRHAMASGGGGMYVFRHNRVEENRLSHAVDAHGVDSNNPISTRGYEIYDNDILNEQVRLWYATGLRGGEGVVFGNRIGSVSGYQVGVMLIQSEVTDYPGYTQIGWASGALYGSSHTGTDPATYGKGDVFVWDNDVSVLTSDLSVYPGQESRIMADRDFHTGVAKPGYASYPYPHPDRRPGFTYVLTGDVSADADSDGLDMLREFFHDTDPRNPDTDGDGIDDGDEVGVGWDPTVADTSIAGVVWDTHSNPVAGVRIATEPPLTSTTSGPDGRFILGGVEAGSVFLSVTRNGYVPLTHGPVPVVSGKATRCDFIVRTNLLSNGGFEDGAPSISGQHSDSGTQFGWRYLFPGQWSYLAPESLTTLALPHEPHSGTEASRHACGSFGWTQIYQDVPVKPEASYTASVWAKAVDLGGGFGTNPGDTCGLIIGERTAGSGAPLFTYPKLQVTEATDYVQLTRTLTTSAATGCIRFVLDTRIGANYAAGWATYDDCVLDGPTIDEPALKAGQIRELPVGSNAYLASKTVTAAFDDCFYVQEQDRSSGIRVTGTASAGDIVDVVGKVAVVGGEATLVSDAVMRRPGGVVPRPLGLGHPAVTSGLSPAGLYISMWGRVCSVGDGSFSMTDGSGGCIKVYGNATENDFVKVVGALGAETSGDGVEPVVRSVSVIRSLN